MVAIDTEWGDVADRADALSGGGVSAAPALLQLAVNRHSSARAELEAEPEPAAEPAAELPVSLPRAWVIDCSKPCPELRRLVRWLLGLPYPGAACAAHGGVASAPTLLGFAFAHDIARLRTLSGHEHMRTPSGHIATRAEAGSSGARPHVIDLQRAAMGLRDGKAYDAVPGAGRRYTPGLGLVCATWLRKRLDKREQCSEWDRRPLSHAQLAYAAADAAVLIEIAVAMGVVV